MRGMQARIGVCPFWLVVSFLAGCYTGEGVVIHDTRYTQTAPVLGSRSSGACLLEGGRDDRRWCVVQIRPEAPCRPCCPLKDSPVFWRRRLLPKFDVVEQQKPRPRPAEQPWTIDCIDSTSHSELKTVYLLPSAIVGVRPRPLASPRCEPPISANQVLTPALALWVGHAHSGCVGWTFSLRPGCLPTIRRSFQGRKERAAFRVLARPRQKRIKPGLSVRRPPRLGLR